MLKCLMKIIIGLGNPQIKYNDTRHNAGFIFLDKLQSQWEFPDFEFNKKFNAEISEGNYKLKAKSYKLFLVKPQTYMNLSGVAVKAILDFYKLSPNDILVIHDDIDIPLGKYKIAVDSSSAGHNGIQNIIDQLGTQKFRRIRVGIGKTPEEKEACQLSMHSYVLEKFTSAELETLKKISGDILEEIKKLL